MKNICSGAARSSENLTDADYDGDAWHNASRANADEARGRATRLDVALKDRGLARSRAQAQELIRDGHVRIDGKTVSKASILVDEIMMIDVDQDLWVSRAAHKLLGALDELQIDIPQRVVDVGASTGGFTQVLLTRGATRVFAVDVGHEQLAGQLRDDARVVELSGRNARQMSLDWFDGKPVDLAVGDVSFISLKLLLEPIFSVLSPSATALLLVKPQFEVGKGRLGAGGVVRNKADHEWAVNSVIERANELGWTCVGQAMSQLLGPSGNKEFFVALRRADAVPNK